jgi:hypothetical protein
MSLASRIRDCRMAPDAVWKALYALLKRVSSGHAGRRLKRFAANRMGVPAIQNSRKQQYNHSLLKS